MRLVRQYLKNVPRIKINCQGYGGIEGSQLVTDFEFEKGIDYFGILEKATQKIFEREQKKLKG